MYSKFGRYDPKGKMIVSQAVIIKVLGIGSSEYYNKKDRYALPISIVHYGYGRIGVKYSLLNGIGISEGYKFQIRRTRLGDKTEFDTYFLLGFDQDMRNIECVRVVPNKGYIQKIGMVTIYKNADASKYDEFKVDAKPYNDAYNDFISFIRGNTTVGIDDIKEWLRWDK